jgi:hypothetical protein
LILIGKSKVVSLRSKDKGIEQDQVVEEGFGELSNYGSDRLEDMIGSGSIIEILESEAILEVMPGANVNPQLQI